MSISNSNGILHDLFTPLPETQTASQKDPLDHAADYADSTTGAWDVFRVFENVLSYVKMLPSLAPNWASVVEKVKSVAGAAGIGLSIPKLVVECNKLRHSISHLFSVQDLPYSDPLRDRKIAHAAKKTFLDSIDLTWTLSQAALFLDSAKIFIFETAQLRLLDCVSNVTSVIADGADLIAECFKLQHYDSPDAQPRNAAESVKLEQKKTLSWMNIAKDVASVGGAAIVLLGIVFGIAVQSIPIVSGAVMISGTLWLGLKLAGYFYSKIVVEAPMTSTAIAARA